eukprot:2049000-Pyramimonas_sp.AAC.1
MGPGGARAGHAVSPPHDGPGRGRLAVGEHRREDAGRRPKPKPHCTAGNGRRRGHPNSAPTH